MKYYRGNIKPGENIVFVFGSNPEGRHGLGSARVAVKFFGAKYGIGEGLVDHSYALPTKNLRVKENKSYKSIPPEDIVESIQRLYQVARENPTLEFNVAYRNTSEPSLNGYTGMEMIEMFKLAGLIPPNIVFSEEWIKTGKITGEDYETGV